MSNRRRLVPESERDELRTTLRSIIESNGNKMTIRSLIKDYKNLNESDLPLDRFGYETALDLITDMDDMFAIEVNDKHRHPNEYFVYCLQTDDNTQHIVDFVQNQRQSEDNDKDVINPNIRVNGLRPKTYNQRSKLIKPFKLVVTNEDDVNGYNRRPNQRNRLNGYNQKPVRKAVCPLPDSRLIPIDEKLRITTLMRKYGSISLSNFGVVYHLFHKCPLDISKYGFKSIDQFLQQLPDLVGFQIRERGLVVFDVSQHHSRQTNGTKMNGHSNGSTNTNHLNGNLNIEQQINGKPMNGKTINEKNVNGKHINGNQMNGNQINGQHSNGDYCNSNQSLNEILMILRKNPNGICLYKLIADYYTTYKKPFISDFWGYGSPAEMFLHMTDVFHLKPPKNGSQNLEEYLLLETTPEIKANLVKTVRKKIVFDEQIKQKVTKVVQKSKQIYISDFNVAFEILYAETIDPKLYGFDDLYKLLTNLSKVCNFDVKERDKNKPFAVYNNRKFK